MSTKLVYLCQKKSNGVGARRDRHSGGDRIMGIGPPSGGKEDREGVNLQWSLSFTLFECKRWGFCSWAQHRRCPSRIDAVSV